MLGYIAAYKAKGVEPIQVRRSRLNRRVLYSIRNRFLEQGCRCGETNLKELECHHRNSSDKKYNIGELIFVNCIPDILVDELAKCEVICRKCHSLYHPDIKEKEHGNVERTI